EAAVGVESDPVRRLGALGVWAAEDGVRLAQRLRLSNADADRLIALERWWQASPEGGGISARALLYRLGPQHFADQVLLAWSRSAAGAPGPPLRAPPQLPPARSPPDISLQAAAFLAPGVSA